MGSISIMACMAFTLWVYASRRFISGLVSRNQVSIGPQVCAF